MPLNPQAVGQSAAPIRFAWTSRDTMLYALGVGCGPSDLPFTTENTRGQPQRVLPTFAVIIGVRGLPYSMLGDFDHAQMVHGFQGIELHGDIPPEGEAEVVASVEGIWDKGGAGVVDLVSECRDSRSGQLLAMTRHSLFCRGEGGWGGDRGPSLTVDFPDREPDTIVALQTREEQALIYRLSGDRNPLHSDPAYARQGGFPKPILHGLCTYGFAGRGLMASLCDNEPSRFRAMSGRFSRPVFPGQGLNLQIWRTEEGAVFRLLNDRAEVVVDHGVCRTS